MLKVVDSYKGNNKRSVIVTFLFGISVLLIIILVVLSFNSNSEFFSVAVWFIPAIMMISAVALGDGSSKIIDGLFSNRVIKHFGNISFEMFLIHQLVIRYLTAIFNKLLNYNGIFIYVSALIISIICAEIWRLLMKKIRS